jgi:predicted transcriptional regulator
MTKKTINKIAEPRISVTITLSSQVIEQLNEISFNTGKHRTDVIRESISHFLKQSQVAQTMNKEI